MNFTDTNAHKTLTDISKNQDSLRVLCGNDSRNKSLIIDHKFLSFDISKQLVTNEILSNFVAMADEVSLSNWIEQYFNGAPINNIENRAVQHTALRDFNNLKPEIKKQLEIIKLVSEAIRQNTKIQNIIMIGIGGSDLGPRFVCDALQEFPSSKNIHFVSNVDGLDLSRALKQCNPDNTIIFILSKTFTTTETMLNARSALTWNGNDFEHIYAVTASPLEAKKFGIHPNQILEFSNDVGGRFSVWSSIGISIAITFGYEIFEQFLKGASDADVHFRNTDFRNNIPFLMAVIGIWNRNYKHYSTHLMAPYDMRLRLVTKYIQQMDMESNGKSIDRNGKTINYKSSPQIYGEVGTDCQHSYMQLVHQGVDFIPVDFIAIKTTPHHLNLEHHVQLLANMSAQAKALAFGQTLAEANNDPFRVFDGNRPSSTFLLNDLTPQSLGFLIALYEHKIFVQGIFWNLNSYDQPGVELGKILAKAEMVLS